MEFVVFGGVSKSFVEIGHCVRKVFNIKFLKIWVLIYLRNHSNFGHVR